MTTKYDNDFRSIWPFGNLPYFCNFCTVTDKKYHCHTDFYEFVFIASGSYKHLFEEQEEILRVGDLVYLPPYHYHRVVEVDSSSSHYALTVKKDYFEQYCKRHLNDDSLFFGNRILHSKLTGAQTAYLTMLGSSFTRSYDEDKIPIADQLLSALLFASQNPSLIGNNIGIEKIVKQLVLHIDNYELLGDNISDIYTRFPISQSTLIEHFKKMTGMTIVEYRNKKRMEYAATLLERENYQVTTVANMVHLSCLSYFSRMFKAQYGITPKQYQKLHHKNKD